MIDIKGTNIKRYVGNKSIAAKDPSGLAEPGFWDDYFRFLGSPSDMDDDLEMGFYASMRMGVGAGAGAVGLTVGGVYGVTAIGSMTMQEITFSTVLLVNTPVYGVSATAVGYAVVEGFIGYPGSLSPDDIIRGIIPKDAAVEEAADLARGFLSEGYKAITNQTGDSVFMPLDGLRKMRFDFNSTGGDLPHVHLEVYRNGRWNDAIKGVHRIYPQP